MYESPDQQWRDLTAHYAAMYEEELLALADDYKDLTEMAQQVLRDEMKKRGLGDPTAPRRREEPAGPESPPAQPSVWTQQPGQGADARFRPEWRKFAEQYASLDEDRLWDLAGDFENLTPVAQDALRFEMNRRNLSDPELNDESEQEKERNALERAERRLAGQRAQAAGDEPRRDADYTWKVTLLDLGTYEEAYQIQEMLRRAKIECWIEAISPGVYRVAVPADRAEEAERIASQPVPQEIVEESKTEIPEYEAPKCPACGAVDPVLEDTEPSNQWLCEACGNEWSEPVAEAKQG